jgi:hypothetical protein
LDQDKEQSAQSDRHDEHEIRKVRMHEKLECRIGRTFCPACEQAQECPTCEQDQSYRKENGLQRFPFRWKLDRF